MVTEKERVTINCSRARKVGQIATLTLEEWQQTIIDFNGQCAYCLVKPFTLLEHYLPVEIAGTHVKNCIPACKSCNYKKSNHKGEILKELFGVDIIEYIENYFTTRQPSNATNNLSVSILDSTQKQRYTAENQQAFLQNIIKHSSNAKKKSMATENEEQAIIVNGRLYYTASQAQTKLELSATQFRKRVNQGLIPRIARPGKNKGLYPKRDVDVLASLDL